MSHCCGLAIYIKEYLKTKRRIMEAAKIYNLQKNPLIETKNPSRYYNSITNLMPTHNLPNVEEKSISTIFTSP